MAEHKIHCPSCAQHLSVPEELAGQQIDCPSCKKPMTLPNFAHAFDEAEEERAEESSSRKSPALIAGIAAGVLIVGAIGFFALSGKDHPGDGQQTATINKTATPETKPKTTAKAYATWQEYKTASQAEGWHYDFADYIDEIPDKENFFMAKPFSGLLYTQEIGGKAVYLNPTINTDFEAVMDLRVYPQHRIQGRQFQDWGDFAKQLRLEPSRTRYGNRATSVKGTDEKVLENYFKQFDSIIGDLREAAKRPKHYFPLAHKNGPDTSLPHLGKLRGLTGLLQESALFKLSRGDADGAMECVRLQFRLFEAAGGGLNLSDHLVRIGIGSIIVTTLNEGLHQGGWNEIHLAEWDKLLNLDENYLKQWERGMQGERLTYVLTIESQINGVDLLDGQTLKEVIELLPKQWLEKDLIFYDSLLKEIIGHFRQANKNGKIDQDQFRGLVSESVTTAKQKGYVLSSMLLPALGGTLGNVVPSVNQFSAARIGVAIERHRRAKNSMPNDLQELVPHYIETIPNNIMTGKPLAWERNGNFRYTISVNENARQAWEYDPILTAIQTGDLDTLKAFVAKGWKINSSGETEYLNQQYALHHAVHSGNLELLQWLIKQGANPNGATAIWTAEKPNTSMSGMMYGMYPYGMGMFGGMGLDDSNQSVLEFAKNERQTEMVKALRDAGASPVKKKTTRKQSNPLGMGMMPGMMPYGMGLGPNDPLGGFDPFGMGFESDEEIKERLAGEIKTINERLAKGRSLNQYNQWGQTELMVAVEADDIDLARRLLENKAYPNATSKDGQLNTALHLAAIQENKELCELLIDKGARVNKKNKIGFTALDSVLQFTDPMPGFEGEILEPTEAHRATVAYLKSKGAKSMTPEERANTDPFGGMIMPGGFGFPAEGMPPGMGMDPNDPFGGFGFPAYGQPVAPKGKKPAQSKRR